MSCRRLVWLAALAFWLALLAAPRGAGAQPLGAERPSPPPWLGIEAAPIFGESSLPHSGWAEVVLRLDNTGQEALVAEAVVQDANVPWAEGRSSMRAPVSVAAGASAHVHLPIHVHDADDPRLEIRAAGGRLLYTTTFRRAADNQVLLVDATRTPALRAALRELTVHLRYDAFALGHHAARFGPRQTAMVEVGTPPQAPATGETVLAERTAAYNRVAAVLIRSDDLARLRGAPLIALGGYVLGGGTLAVVVSRPDDLRHPNLETLLGGQPTLTETSEPLVSPIVLHEQPTGAGGGERLVPDRRQIPRAGPPEPALQAVLQAFAGGNLAPSAYGSSATYGLGEVHLLSFDPTKAPAVDSPWAAVRMLDLLRRATERRATVVFSQGGPAVVSDAVRRQLDPNEGARWAIVVSALLLCFYAAFAGPVNFGHWRSRGKPLRALLVLPIASALTFGAIAAVGVAAKGCEGRARQLTFVDAGAGMSHGTARRWRGFFLPSAQEIDVAASDGASVLGPEQEGTAYAAADRLLLDKDGLHVTDLPVRPWQTRVVREDTIAALGGGIALVARNKGAVRVINRTGRRLRGLVVRPASGPMVFFPSLAPGEALDSDGPGGEPLIGAAPPQTSGGITHHAFNVLALREPMDEASEGLAAAWSAVQSAQPSEADWFPDGVPVVLAQIDGGDGRTADAGLRLESTRTLVRVVGYGGQP